MKSFRIVSGCLLISQTFGFASQQSAFCRSHYFSDDSSLDLLEHVPSATALFMASRGSYGRSSARRGQAEIRSKRQERVGHLVRVELAQIVQSGSPIRYAEYIEEELRRTVNIVNADVSPDLRQARITVSIIGSEAAQKRRIYAWLVDSTKLIRHALSQRLSHMKTIPNLSFVLADVGAAVDVMNLIERISSDSKYKRETLGWDGSTDEDASDVPTGIVGGLDFDEDDDDGWIDEDEDEYLEEDEDEYLEEDEDEYLEEDEDEREAKDSPNDDENWTKSSVTNSPR